MGSVSKVYFTKEITPEKVVEIYDKLGKKLDGNVAIKVHSGEAGNQNFLRPEFWKPVVEHVGGTIVECNTAYEGERNSTEKHVRLIEAHGWNRYFKVDLMDREGPDVELPIRNGKHLASDIVGKNFLNYDSMLVLSHFKGHPMGGYGGALKQLSIGCASTAGKVNIHSAGKYKKTEEQAIVWDDHSEQNAFLESMADAAKAAVDAKEGRWVFINVLCGLQPDDDCAEAEPLPDIGILASLDPVAVDQAAVDFTFGAAPAEDVRKKWEEKHNVRLLQYAEERGIGKRHYRLKEVV